MNFKRALLALSISATLISMSACKPQAGVKADDKYANETADQFIERVNTEMRADYPEVTSAQWLASTYINGDSEIVSSKANERALAKLSTYIAKAKTFKDSDPMSSDTKRALQLLKLGVTLPPPNDPKQLAELTQLATKLDGMYGAGKY
ncbi:MAG: M2 family metallopeptidase, partial [Arenimonas sp.]